MSKTIIIRALLRTNGILANIDNFEHCSVDWGAVAALGGVTVRVPAEQAHQAAELMITAVRTANERLSAACDELDNTPIRNQRLKAWSMIFLFIGGAGLLFAPAIWALDYLLPPSFFVTPTAPGWVDPVMPLGASQGYVTGGGIDSSQAGAGLLFLSALLVFIANEMLDAKLAKRTHSLFEEMTS